MITASEELKKNPDLKEPDLHQLKDWISKQPHLPKNATDELLILIMHSCYFSIEQSKATVENYYTLRSHLPEFFTQRNIHSKELRQAHDTVNVILLEQRTKEGYRVAFGGFKNTDPSAFDFADSMKLLFMTYDATFLVDGTTSGDVIVIDFTGMKLSHLGKLTLPTMKKVLTVLQDMAPVRLKGLHFINIVPFIDKVVALMKPFMRKDLIDMLVLHAPGSDSIFKVVPKEAFPQEYGGSAGTLNQLRDRTFKMLERFENWYKEDERMRVDETKRPGKAKSAGELFGVDGSFRKLAID